eukprot:8659562-Pyramimonas_sp.AAC.1
MRRPTWGNAWVSWIPLSPSCVKLLRGRNLTRQHLSVLTAAQTRKLRHMIGLRKHGGEPMRSDMFRSH